ncbi:MAG: ribose 5-phosphate isomerase B [Saprospiraceae bacterium]|nr:ribose 5-phosphate isomerase B [Saprospiraceae bacterium]
MGKIISIGSDHAGFELKEKLLFWLPELGYSVIDHGCFDTESVDYPDYGKSVGVSTASGASEIGIVICGSGNGIAIAANKVKGIRCALCWNPEISKLARLHNNANVLALPARFINEEEAKMIVSNFLNTNFEGGRHEARVNKIEG